MAVFDYDDYKLFVNEWIADQPRGGHGLMRKIAEYLSINSVVMSQVFRGDRDLSVEQALGITKFVGLNELERDFFLLLVQEARAGTTELKSVYKKQREAINEAAQSLKNRIKHSKFSEEDRATFYSQWYYSAVRLGISIPGLESAGAIAEYLHLDRALVVKIIDFLGKHGLVIEKNGSLKIGPSITHVGHDSPFVGRHHTNWRLKGIQAQEKSNTADMFYSGPMALSEDAAEKIRKLLIETIEKSTKAAATSDSEVLRCLNIDWFAIKGS
ncbi:MAG TPA: TIGR02147 family protein [Bdellovibrionales bacterium]|nr:TIGR02147 family protein [Bdellovibrionales bacterium]